MFCRFASWEVWCISLYTFVYYYFKKNLITKINGESDCKTVNFKESLLSVNEAEMNQVRQNYRSFKCTCCKKVCEKFLSG